MSGNILLQKTDCFVSDREMTNRWWLNFKNVINVLRNLIQHKWSVCLKQNACY